MEVSLKTEYEDRLQFGAGETPCRVMPITSGVATLPPKYPVPVTESVIALSYDPLTGVVEVTVGGTVVTIYLAVLM